MKVYANTDGFAAVQFVDPETYEVRVEPIELVDGRWTVIKPGTVPEGLLKELDKMECVIIEEALNDD